MNILWSTACCQAHGMQSQVCRNLHLGNPCMGLLRLVTALQLAQVQVHPRRCGKAILGHSMLAVLLLMTIYCYNWCVCVCVCAHVRHDLTLLFHHFVDSNVFIPVTQTGQNTGHTLRDMMSMLFWQLSVDTLMVLSTTNQSRSPTWLAGSILGLQVSNFIC